jgi:hypothetical protein
MRGWLLFPQPEMAKDPFYDIRLMRVMIFISWLQLGQLRGSTSQIPAFAGTSPP